MNDFLDRSERSEPNELPPLVELSKAPFELDSKNLTLLSYSKELWRYIRIKDKLYACSSKNFTHANLSKRFKSLFFPISDAGYMRWNEKGEYFDLSGEADGTLTYNEKQRNATVERMAELGQKAINRYASG